MEIHTAAEFCERIISNVEKVIQGKTLVIKQALACWLAGGHLLIEDVPGTGKTMLARAIARSVNVPMRRVQFTPDLMPSDIIGTSIYSKEKNKFIFHPGPLFTSVLVADELNRGNPRTQAALLQAMAEGQCTADNQTYRLPESFFVVATQNPSDQHGTFPLPEAQLDRFMVRISVGYPGPANERDLIRAQLIQHPIEALNPVLVEQDWAGIRAKVKQIEVSDAALNYAVQLTIASRSHHHLVYGASPRASIALIRCAQAFALIAGESFVKPDVIKKIAPAVLEHRLTMTTKARLERIGSDQIVSEIIHQVPVPIKKAS